MSLANLRDGNVKVAVALAAVAAVLTMIFVARSGSGSTAAAAAATNGSTVFVANHDIPLGTGGSALLDGNLLKQVSLAPAAIEPGAITSKNELSGLVTQQPIYAGEQLSTHFFGRSGATAALAGLAGTGRVMELAGDPRQILAGVVQPGDHVDVAASLKRANGETYGKVVLRNLVVRSVSASDSSSAGLGDSSDGDDWVTLELSDTQAATLLFVEKNGDWSLILRPLHDPASSTTGAASADTILAGRG